MHVGLFYVHSQGGSEFGSTLVAISYNAVPLEVFGCMEDWALASVPASCVEGGKLANEVRRVRFADT